MDGGGLAAQMVTLTVQPTKRGDKGAEQVWAGAMPLFPQPIILKPQQNKKYSSGPKVHLSEKPKNTHSPCSS